MKFHEPQKPFAVELDELFLFLLQHIPDRIYFKDADSRFIWVSDAMAKFLGASGPAELVGKSDFDFFTREHAQPAFDDERAVMRSGEPMIGKIEKETLPDGRIGWAMTTKIPLRDATGAIVGTCGISRDFTTQKALEDSLARTNAELERNQIELEKTLAELTKTHAELKAAQQDLIEAEKMRAQARFVFGIAHEIRNPLNVVNMAAEFLKTQTGVPQEILATMQDAIQQADAVISALMDATDASGLHLAPADLETIVRGAASLLQESPGVTVTMEVDSNVPEVPADPAKLEQCFRGILRNAVDAMNGEGRLNIRLRCVRLRESDIQRSAGSRSASWLKAGGEAAEVRIADSGPGIPPDVLANLFDPFLTTKPAGKGTGLGLMVCRRIIELHHGAIRIENGPDGGAVATVLLPFAGR